jgi:hypothetical protein
VPTSETQPLRTVEPVDARPNRTWAPGRVCERAGCDTRLSVYNRSAMCWVHEEPRMYIVRGKRRRRDEANRGIA